MNFKLRFVVFIAAAALIGATCRRSKVPPTGPTTEIVTVTATPDRIQVGETSKVTPSSRTGAALNCSATGGTLSQTQNIASETSVTFTATTTGMAKVSCSTDTTSNSVTIDVSPALPPGVQLMTVPTGPLRMKRQDGSDSWYSLNVKQISPAPGTDIIREIRLPFPPCSAPNDLARCFEITVEQCSANPDEYSGADIFLSENQGQFQRRMWGIPARPGCHTLEFTHAATGATLAFATDGPLPWLEFRDDEEEWINGEFVRRTVTLTGLYVGYR